MYRCGFKFYIVNVEILMKKDKDYIGGGCVIVLFFNIKVLKEVSFFEFCVLYRGSIR